MASSNADVECRKNISNTHLFCTSTAARFYHKSMKPEDISQSFSSCVFLQHNIKSKKKDFCYHICRSIKKDFFILSQSNLFIIPSDTE